MLIKTSSKKDLVGNVCLFVGQSEKEEQEADLVTAIFDLLEEKSADIQGSRVQLESAVREHFSGMRGTITAKPDAVTTAKRVLSMFNGRNTSEIARKLDISRQHVYRILKQPGNG